MTPRVGLQLFTVREQLARDLSDTLARVAAIGYPGVETAFFDEAIPLAEAARELRAHGLTVFAAHVPLPLGPGRDLARRSAEAFDCRRVVWHGWPRDDRYDSLDGIRRLAAEFNEAGANAAADGLVFGIHNHWWECEPVEGRVPYRVLLEELDPAVFVEFDAYWAQVGGLDPAAFAAELGARMPLLHLKDGPGVYEEPRRMVALGSGALAIPPIIRAAGATLEWAVVELDRTETDVFAAVAQSYAYLTGQGLATGRE
jgi:sugar phosphate isomerase/epimerase